MTEPNVRPLRRRRACPVCGKPEAEASRPFCSRRCADLDLSRWLGGVYRLPGEEEAGPEDLAAALAEDRAKKD